MFPFLFPLPLLVVVESLCCLLLLLLFVVAKTGGLFIIKQDDKVFNFCLLLADRLAPNNFSALELALVVDGVDELILLFAFVWSNFDRLNEGCDCLLFVGLGLLLIDVVVVVVAPITNCFWLFKLDGAPECFEDACCWSNQNNSRFE